MFLYLHNMGRLSELEVMQLLRTAVTCRDLSWLLHFVHACKPAYDQLKILCALAVQKKFVSGATYLANQLRDEDVRVFILMAAQMTATFPSDPDVWRMFQSLLKARNGKRLSLADVCSVVRSTKGDIRSFKMTAEWAEDGVLDDPWVIRTAMKHEGGDVLNWLAAHGHLPSDMSEHYSELICNAISACSFRLAKWVIDNYGVNAHPDTVHSIESTFYHTRHEFHTAFHPLLDVFLGHKMITDEFVTESLCLCTGAYGV